MEFLNNLYENIYNLYNKVVDYSIKAMYYYPGEGEIFKIKNRCYIKYPGGNIRLNYIRLPDIDNTVGLFYDDLEHEKLQYTISEFNETFKEEEIYQLQKYSTGIIDDVYNTKNIRNGIVHGFIKSPLEDNVYIFKLEEGKIDFESLFEEYRDFI